jgi:membrane protein implicated in regulation of membrane protease activity
MFIDLTWAAALSTQFVAARLGYHHHLGGALFRAPIAAAAWLEGVAVICGVIAVVCLWTWRWRPALLPLLVVAVSTLAVRNGPVYSPTRVFVWYAAYRRIPEYGHIFAAAWVILAASSIVLIMSSWRLLRSAPQAGAPFRGSNPSQKAGAAVNGGRLPTRSLSPAGPTARLRTAGRARIPVR